MLSASLSLTFMGKKMEPKVSEKAIGVILSKLKLPDFGQPQLLLLEL